MKIGKQKIRCRSCGALLTINVKEENINKSLRCPVCKNIAPLLQYEVQPEESIQQERIQQPAVNEAVNNNIPSYNDESTRLNTPQEPVERRYEPEPEPEEEARTGMLIIKSNNKTFTLKEGHNIIGRNGEGTEADFKIDTPNEKRISREHIIIDVMKDGRIYNHSVKLYKKEVNITYVNGSRLEYGDSVILKDGDNIELPGVTLQFIIP